MARTIRGFDKAKAVREASLRGALEGARTSEATAKSVLMMLTTYTDDRGVAWPSVSTLARNTGLSPSCVRRACAALRDMGVLEFDDAKGGRRSAVRTVRFDRLPCATTPPTRRDHPAPCAPPARATGATNRTENPPGKRPAEQTHEPSPPRTADSAEPTTRTPERDAAASLSGLGFGEQEAKEVCARHAVTNVPTHTLALLALGVDAPVVRRLVARHPKDAILVQVRSVNAKRNSKQPPRNVAAYVVKAIREDWSPCGALVEQERCAKRRDTERRIERERNARREREEAFARELKEQRTRTMERLRAMPDDEINDAWRRFLDSRPPVNRLALQKHNPRKNPVAAGLLLGWMENAGVSNTPERAADARPIHQTRFDDVLPGNRNVLPSISHEQEPENAARTL